MDWDLVYNYYALTAAIFRPDLSADDAINLFSPATKRQPSRACRTEETCGMLALVGVIPYGEIGKLYGLSPSGVAMRVKRYKDRYIKKAAH